MGGLCSFCLIITAYYFLKKFIDVNVIVIGLKSKEKINIYNYAYVSAYIVFGNSFLEEYFFRYFIFHSLRNKKREVIGYIFSSLLFSAYHIAIFSTWFSWQLIILIFIALTIIGIIFCNINAYDKNNSISNSWLVHIFSDLAIVIIEYNILIKVH